MDTRLFVLFNALAIALAAPESQSKTPVRQVVGDYFIDRLERTWDSAGELCRSMNMTLVSIKDVDKDTEIKELFEAEDLGDLLLWTCGTKDGDKFIWADDTGDEVVYNRWYPGEPNDEASPRVCVHFQPTHGWFDTDCNFIGMTLCQPLEEI